MLHSERAQRDRSRLLLGVGLVVAACGVLDFVLLDGFPAAALAIRIPWAGSMLLLGAIGSRLSPRAFDLSFRGIALITGAAWLALTVITGGSASPYFWWMLTLPLFMGVLAPDNLVAAIVAAVWTLAGNLVVLILEGAGFAAGFTWSVIALTSGGLACAGVVAYRRLLQAELERERARARAEEELAISEQRRAHAEKLALVGKLVAGIAHEINNPLAYVKSNLDHLQDEHGPCPYRAQLRQLLLESQEGIGRIEQIVADLRSFSRFDDEAPTSCALAPAVEEAVRIASVRIRRVARVEVELARNLPLVVASHSRLVQVVVNLLVNAGDALADGGGGTVRIAAACQGGTVVLVVDDDGPGIPEGVRERLFDPFFTTKPAGAGTGLGLPLSREYLERFGASIEAETAPAGGARFRITLQTAALDQAAAA